MRFDRVWSMPSKNTFSMKPIKQLIEEEKLSPLDGIVEELVKSMVLR